MILHARSNDVLVWNSVGFPPTEAAVLCRLPLASICPSNAGALLKTASDRYAPRRTRLSTRLQGPPIDTILLHYLWARSLNLSKQIQCLTFLFRYLKYRTSELIYLAPCNLPCFPKSRHLQSNVISTTHLVQHPSSNSFIIHSTKCQCQTQGK